MRISRRTLAASAVAAALVTSTASCGLQGANQFIPAAEPGSIEVVPSLEDVEVIVAGKSFTEQLILTKMLAIALDVAGADVVDRSGIPSSVSARSSLVEGGSDVQFEYTGTAWLTYLGQTETIPDPQEQYEAVRDLDVENGLTWLPPSPMENAYAFAMGPGTAAELGITTTSQIAEVPVEDRTFCLEPEFRSRSDGFEPLLEAYDLPLGSPEGVPADQVGIYDLGVVYSETAAGSCSFGEVFTTDGRIAALDLTVLEDDRDFFPAYNAALVFHTETLDAHPELADVLQPISQALSNDVLIELNRRVDVDGEDPALVARDWLASEGFVTCEECEPVDVRS
ncbi:glycine betaine ABC transporter substrate-binding protein [Pseudokineococcus basanitobsidens]|uniref:Glycine betaine ABC transporter substrate-binding protein n=1 Tax=Pseudokineococcus basanitobsidens TaxID=1926649 RepID=A0ABU8RN67_9ACTN